jgi:hypothetical protein
MKNMKFKGGSLATDSDFLYYTHTHTISSLPCSLFHFILSLIHASLVLR